MREPLESCMKRALDLSLASAALLALSPLFAVIAALIKRDSPGPVLFRQTRVGRGGRHFTLLKFRTMACGASSAHLLTCAEDARVTPLGQRLRHWKLDELPQLINVLRGDMALVGPRPEVPRYVALYTPEQREVLRVRPGVTDIASIYYRNESSLLIGDNAERLYIEEIMPRKLALSRAYLARRSLTSDVRILVWTLRCTLSPTWIPALGKSTSSESYAEPEEAALL